jgi:hypothetical protein
MLPIWYNQMMRPLGPYDFGPLARLDEKITATSQQYLLNVSDGSHAALQLVLMMGNFMLTHVADRLSMKRRRTPHCPRLVIAAS